MKKSGFRTSARVLPFLLSAMVLASLSACGQKSPPPAPPSKSGSLIEKTNPQAQVPAVPRTTSGPAIAEVTDDNTALTAQVKAALVDNPVLSPFAFDVVTERGIVWLFGTVDTMDNRAKAGDFILKQPGVQSVRNNIHLTNGTIVLPAPPPATLASNK